MLGSATMTAVSSDSSRNDTTVITHSATHRDLAGVATWWADGLSGAT